MLQHKQTIGRLDREITIIQAIISNATSNADEVTGWEVIDTDPNVNAAKSEKAGTVYSQADRLTFTQQTEWTIRHRSDLNIRMRIVWDTKVYEIFNIVDADDSRSRYTKILTNLLDNTFFT